MTTSIALVGDGTAAAAVREALEEYPAESGTDAPAITVENGVAPALEDADLGIVVGRVGSDTFAETAAAAKERATPWIAVELGGIGGYPVVGASIAGLSPAGPCEQCLETRVAANLPADTDPVPAPGIARQRVAGSLAAEMAVTWAEGDRDAVVGRVIERPHADRLLLPVPGCECGSARSFALERGQDAVDVETALGWGEQTIDDRLGVISSVGEAESFPAPYYLASLTDTTGFSDVRAPSQAAGVATDWNAAFMKAVGESCERYAAGVYDATQFQDGNAVDATETIDPAQFVAPDDDRDGADTDIDWLPATDLATGDTQAVPASLVVHPPTVEPIRPAVTTGLGLHTSSDGGLRSGLTEVIERDAAMIAWYSTFEPLGLSVADETYATLKRRAAAEDLSVSAVLLTQDIDVPVVAVALQRDSWPAFAVGSAGALDPVEAARSALEEALQNWMELRGMGEDDAADASGAIGRYASHPGQAASLFAPETTVPASSVGPESVPAPGERLDLLIERVTDAGLRPLATRLTTRDLEAVGYEAVRVLVPAAQPLFFDEPYFGERATAVPASHGFEPRLDRAMHPFP
jgi:ribosomal protein S12 methylthiotransferase accessory factor